MRHHALAAWLTILGWQLVVPQLMWLMRRSPGLTKREIRRFVIEQGRSGPGWPSCQARVLVGGAAGQGGRPAGAGPGGLDIGVTGMLPPWQSVQPRCTVAL